MLAVLPLTVRSAQPERTSTAKLTTPYDRKRFKVVSAAKLETVGGKVAAENGTQASSLVWKRLDPPTADMTAKVMQEYWASVTPPASMTPVW
mmetsp:Transcript_97661/g.244751  ORF Transcript_97661/g.244751 Transcript_97661/m.244751 type:complete len:92 (-) Transcript_97661:605-880(-)